MKGIIVIAALAATVAQTSPIGIVERQGARRAAHHLVIISAYSCPYCRVLDQQGMPEIRSTWLSRGLEVETVPFILHATDIAATIAATCGEASGYARRSTILFRAQPDIQGNWSSADSGEKSRAAAIPNAGGAPAIARLSGIDQLGPSLGISKKQLSACMDDPARQRAVTARQNTADARWRIAGTPTVLLDGRPAPTTWPALRVQIEAAVK